MQKRGYSVASLKEYFIRRYFRIAPMFYLGIIIYFLANCFFINRFDSSLIRYYTPTGILVNVLFLNGFVPAYNNTIVPGAWSIGTEMAFYLVFPLLFVWLNNKKVGYIVKVLLAYTIVVILLLLIQSTLSAIRVLHNDNFWYYNFLNQLPVFMWGILLYKQVTQPFVKNQVTAIAMMITGIVLFFLFWSLEQRFAASFFLVPFFAGMAMFALGCLLQRLQYVFKPLNSIGQASFSIYIFHFLITHYLFPYLYESYLFRIIKNTSIVFALDFVLTLAVSFGIAAFTRAFIEEPGIKLGNKLIARLKAHVTGDGFYL
jgi:peptidoglycan/LPS O-acetylase OafA/YrhL